MILGKLEKLNFLNPVILKARFLLFCFKPPRSLPDLSLFKYQIIHTYKLIIVAIFASGLGTENAGESIRMWVCS